MRALLKLVLMPLAPLCKLGRLEIGSSQPLFPLRLAFNADYFASVSHPQRQEAEGDTHSKLQRPGRSLSASSPQHPRSVSQLSIAASSLNNAGHLSSHYFVTRVGNRSAACCSVEVGGASSLNLAQAPLPSSMITSLPSQGHYATRQHLAGMSGSVKAAAMSRHSQLKLKQSLRLGAYPAHRRQAPTPPLPIDTNAQLVVLLCAHHGREHS